MRLVKIEAKLAIYDQTPEELLARFDGLIAPDGLSITNIKDKKIMNECLDFRFTEIIEFTDEEEEKVFLKKGAELNYHISKNKTFKERDMIRIDDKGDYNIVISSDFALLCNCESQNIIRMDNVKCIDDVKLYLENNYPEYIVLRKVT